jgi:hypothetical protein
VTPLRGSLRFARAADLPRLTELWIEIATHHTALDPLFTLRPGAESEVQRLIAALFGDPDAAIFVWEAADDLLGFCAVRIDRAGGASVGSWSPPHSRGRRIGASRASRSASRRGTGKARLSGGASASTI